MRTIYLLRHGEPTYPGGRRCCLGSTDVPLSPRGHAQGAKLGEYFSAVVLDGVYCSAMRRAQETAGYLSPAFQLVPDLHELGVGDWEGLTFPEIRERYPSLYAQRGEDPLRHVMPGGEAPTDCLRRVKAAFDDLLADTRGDIAIVAHAGVNRLLLCHLMGLELKQFLTLPQPYGCINILCEQDGTLTVQGIGILPQ